MRSSMTNLQRQMTRSQRARRVLPALLCFHGFALFAAVALLIPSCKRKDEPNRYSRPLSADEHTEMTRFRLAQLALIIRSSFSSRSGYPAELSALPEAKRSPNFGAVPVRQSVFLDSWGRNIQYRVAKDRMSFTLTSLAADGEPGGLGAAADLSIDVPESAD